MDEVLQLLLNWVLPLVGFLLFIAGLSVIMGNIMVLYFLATMWGYAGGVTDNISTREMGKNRKSVIAGLAFMIVGVVIIIYSVNINALNPVFPWEL